MSGPSGGNFNVNITKHLSGAPQGVKKAHNNRDLLGTKEEQQMRLTAMTQRPNDKEESYVRSLRPQDHCLIAARRQEE